MKAGPDSVFMNCPFCGKIMFFKTFHMRQHVRRIVLMARWYTTNKMPGTNG